MLPIFILLTIALAAAEKYSIPEPKFQLLKPKGFRASIPDVDGIRLFAFHGNLNKELEDMGIGQFSGDVMRKQNGKWVFENRKLKLRQGDVINYWVFVMKNGEGYTFTNGSYKCKLDAGRFKRHAPWRFLSPSEFPPWKGPNQFYSSNEFSDEHEFPSPTHYFSHHRYHIHHNHHHNHDCHHEHGYEYPDPDTKIASDEEDDEDVFNPTTEDDSEETTRILETTNEVTTGRPTTDEITTSKLTDEFTTSKLATEEVTSSKFTTNEVFTNEVFTSEIRTEAASVVTGEVRQRDNEGVTTTAVPTTTNSFPQIDIRFGI